MPKLGQLVYYKMDEAPQRYFPAIVTRPFRTAVSLMVFTEEGCLNLLGIPEGTEPGTWRPDYPPEEQTEPPVASSLSAGHFAKAFMNQYGQRRQHITEDVMKEWFEAAFKHEHFPRAAG